MVTPQEPAGSFGSPRNERERFGAPADFDRSTLGHSCSRCDAPAPFVVQSTQVQPVEDGPPWLCALDETPGPFVGILCATCMEALQAWVYTKIKP